MAPGTGKQSTCINQLEVELQHHSGDLPSDDDLIRRTQPNQDNMFIPIPEESNSTLPPTTISVNVQAELQVEQEARMTDEDRCMKLVLEIESQKASSDTLVKSWKGTTDNLYYSFLKHSAD